VDIRANGTSIGSIHHRTARHPSVTERPVRAPACCKQRLLMDSKKQSSEHGWHEQAEASKREAEKLPYGRAREGCCARPGKWVSSPGLSSPK